MQKNYPEWRRFTKTLHDSYGESAETFLQRFNDLLDTFPGARADVKVEFEYGEDYFQIDLWTHRPETDEERAGRLKSLELQKENRRKQYEALKAEFE